MRDLEETFNGKKILITGGAGSIGSEIVRQILKFNPDVVRVFDISEKSLFDLQNELKDYANVRFLIGDVRDKNRVKRAMEDINIIFHAAALKHVPFCEYNPFEAIQTNVLGTQNIIDLAQDTETVEKFINISTDKAANPASTMGVTKLLAEKMTTWATFYRKKHKPICASVRFGNVMGSSGSVIPIFKEQIRKGGPITITDNDMRRFMMSIEDSVKLVLNSAAIAKGGEIFVLKMPVVRIGDLAEVMIETTAPIHGFSPSEIRIEKIGARVGEKFNEYLLTEDEAKFSLETPDMFIISPLMQLPSLDPNRFSYRSEFKVAEIKNYTTKDMKILSKAEIKDFLQKRNLIS